MPVDIRVEVAFDSGYGTLATARTWTDVTEYVEADRPISITYGRSDEFSTPDANKLTGLRLDNRDGRFTAGRAASPYYPNVKVGRPIRVLVNCLPNPGFEADTSGWAATNAALARVSTPVQSGTGAARLTASAAGTMLLSTPSGTSGLPVLPGEPMVAGAWLRAAATARTCNVKVTWYTAAGATISTTTAATGADSAGNYTRLRGEVTAPSTAAFARVQIEIVSAALSEIHYVDDVELSRPRFTGYIDQWPVEWTGGSGTFAVATVSASSRLPRLGLTAAPPEFLDTEIINQAPNYYWPLTDPSTSHSGVEVSGAAPDIEEFQRTISFGSGGKGGDSPVFGVDGRSAIFVPQDLTNVPLNSGGAVGRVALPTPVSFGPGAPGAMSLSAFVQFLDEGGGSVRNVTIFNQANPEGDPVAFSGVVGIGKSGVRTSYGSDGVSSTYNATVSYPVDVRDKEPHHVGLTVECNGTSVTIKGWLDGAYIGATTSSLPISSYNLTHLDIRAQDRDFRVGRVAFWDHAVSSVTMETIGSAGILGFPGDTIDTRMNRVATWCRVPLAEIVTPGSSITVSGLETKDGLPKPIDMFRALETTEAGVLHDDRAGRLVLRSRSARYNTATALTIDASAQLLGRDFEPRIDRQGLTNIATATNDLGTVSVTYKDEDSRDEYGDTAYSVETLAEDVEEPLRLAAARVNATSQPRPRAPSAQIDVLNWAGADLAAVMGLDVGSKITVTNAPDQAPSATSDFFVEGYSESLAPFAWRISPNLSPGWPVGDYLVLDSATDGLLDQNALAL